MEDELGTLMYLNMLDYLARSNIDHDYETIIQYCAAAMAHTEDLVDHTFSTDITYTIANEISKTLPARMNEGRHHPYEITYQLCARGTYT